jgi:hypothetical protein
MPSRSRPVKAGRGHDLLPLAHPLEDACADAKPDLGHSELLDPIKDEPPDFQPGEKFSYNIGLANGELAGRRRVSHGGGINGFASSLAHYPDDGVVVAVLVNSGGTKVDAIAEKVAPAALGAGPAAAPRARPPR